MIDCVKVMVRKDEGIELATHILQWTAGGKALEFVPQRMFPPRGLWLQPLQNCQHLSQEQWCPPVYAPIPTTKPQKCWWGDICIIICVSLIHTQWSVTVFSRNVRQPSPWFSPTDGYSAHEVPQNDQQLWGPLYRGRSRGLLWHHWERSLGGLPWAQLAGMVGEGIYRVAVPIIHITVSS